jgi:O-antigen ligase
MAVPAPIPATNRNFSLASAGLLVALAALIAALPLAWSAGLFAAALLGLGVILQPGLGVILLALALPFGSLWAPPAGGANAVDLLVAVVVVAWALKGMAARDWRITMPVPAWPLLAFIWVAALSLTAAPSWEEGAPEWLKWAEVAVVYVVGAQVLTRRQAWWMAAALLAAGVLEAALGAHQFLRQAGPEAFILLGRFMRAYGTFGQPNPYAGYLGYLAPVAASLAIAGLVEGFRRRKWSYAAAGAAAGAAALAIIAGIGMSWSRGAWIALAAALVVVVGFRSRRAVLATMILLVIGATALGLFGAGWLPGSLAGRVSEITDFVGLDPALTEITDANFSVLERIAHWQAGLAMFGDHPWLGVGIGNYAAAYPQYAPPHWYEPLGHAHNIAIHLLAETGILGGLAFLAYWLALAAAAMRALPGADPARRAYALGILGTWVYVSIHGAFDNLFVQHIQLNLALLWAGLIALGVATTGSSLDSSPTMTSRRHMWNSRS